MSNATKAKFRHYTVIVIALCFVLSGCNKPKEELKTSSVVEVPAVQVVSKTLFREDQLPGEIMAYQDVLIYPKVPGFVKWIGVDRGSVVKKGELMVTMYAPEYLASRNEAYSRVASAQAAVASAESRLQSTQADLEHRRANLLADE